MSRTTTGWIDPADGAILTALARAGPDHGPVLAHRLGVSNDTFEARCRRLEAAGVIERVTEEPLYRLTASGHRVAQGRATR